MAKKGVWAGIFAYIVPIVLYFSLTNCFSVKILDELNYDNFDGVIASEMPNYTNFVDTNKYLSGNIVFDPVALAGYYRLTENFMNAVLDPNFITEDMIEWEQDGDVQYPKFTGDFISELLKKNWAFVLIIVITLLIAVVTPIVGIIFCCCRCCGNCGCHSRPSDKKKDNTKKAIYGVLLISFGTILLMTVVCVFATNKQMYEGVSEFPDSIRESYGDGTMFLDSVRDQASELLQTNYDQFAEVFNNTLRNSGDNILQNLDIWSNASAIIKLDDFVRKIVDIKKKMQQLMADSNTIKGEVVKLGKGLNDTKSSLTNVLDTCSVKQCTDMKKSISTINLNINIDELPDANEPLNQLGMLNVDKLIEAANAGSTALKDLTTRINRTIDENTNKAYEAIQTGRTTINENFDNFTQVISDLQVQLKNVNSTMEDSYHYIKDYSPYIYYGGLVMSCVLLLIVACIAFGLVFGIFGRRPDGGKYGRKFLTKDTGSTFLTSSVLLIFVFTCVIGILTFVMMVAGLLVERGICYPMRNPEHSSVINIINKLVSDNATIDLKLNVSEILVKCRDNESLYNVFELSNKIDLDTLVKNFNISEEVNSISKQISEKLNDILPKNFSILSSDQLNDLKQLESVKPNVDLDGYEKQLNQDILNADLQNVIDSLEQILKLPTWTDEQLAQLTDSITNLKDQLKIVQSIKTTANQTLDLAKSLNDDLLLNSTSFSDGVTDLLGNIEIANKDLKNESSKLVEAAKSFGKFVGNLVEGYLDRVVNVIKNDLGQCGHLSVAIDSLLIATCDKIFLPWNGFWVALFISLLVFIPTWTVSIVLTSLYKKYKITGEFNRSPSKRSKRDVKKTKPDNTKNYQPGSFYDGTATEGTASDFFDVNDNQKSTRF
ncbi:unnamed protein product [Phyllotreta striolata]|uniref:Prominin-like protein n=1 Tax=Phyllotreta striolata TaxID=444603 RepID=A0A9N9TP10_PHYSR|nr:unnamed protein product [Phyllotreta striolata]